MSRRPSRDETDQDIKWFHGKISRQEAETILTTDGQTFTVYHFFVLTSKLNRLIFVSQKITEKGCSSSEKARLLTERSYSV